MTHSPNCTRQTLKREIHDQGKSETALFAPTALRLTNYACDITRFHSARFAVMKKFFWPPHYGTKETASHLSVGKKIRNTQPLAEALH
jgi:hypothetical protein